MQEGLLEEDHTVQVALSGVVVAAHMKVEALHMQAEVLHTQAEALHMQAVVLPPKLPLSKFFQLQ